VKNFVPESWGSIKPKNVPPKTESFARATKVGRGSEKPKDSPKG